MITFKDLKFKTHPNGRGLMGFYIFENGYRISVVCGEFAYSTPRLNLPNVSDYKEFEIAVLKPNGDWATQEFFPDHNDDVLGWQSEAAITELMGRIETVGIEKV